jgi:hypothetical protein
MTMQYDESNEIVTIPLISGWEDICSESHGRLDRWPVEMDRQVAKSPR